MSEFALSALTTLLVILDPVGLVPIFLSLTSGMDAAARRRVALLACTLAAGIMIAFAVIGAALLAQLGISLAAFRIAGGLLLFYTAFEMVFDLRRERRRSTAAEKGGEAASATEHATAARTTPAEVRRLAAFPLAVPLLAGPGAITAVILLAGRAGDTAPAQALLIAVILAACAIALVLFLAAEPLDRLLGETGKIVLTRLLGVLLAALAVQFVADGVIEIARTAWSGA